jgi:hypothetical protein
MKDESQANSQANSQATPQADKPSIAFRPMPVNYLAQAASTTQYSS